MAGMESSPVPVEPAKTHAARVGRGGVGNYLEAKKWENSSIPAATGTKTGTTKTAAEVPVKLDTLVLPPYPPYTILPLGISLLLSPTIPTRTTPHICLHLCILLYLSRNNLTPCA